MTIRHHVSAWGFALLALGLRLWNLGSPKGYIFDEVYYAKNANSLIKHGVELESNGSAEFIVHPPVGKWIIGLGIKIFGNNEFGWRFSSAIIGSLSIALIFYVAQKLFSNYFLSCSAAFLTLMDGLHLVHSRTALLDIFLMFFILLAFYFLLLNWNWAAGFALGLSLATKWSGIYYIVAFALFVLYVDYRREKAMENGSPIRFIALHLLWKRTIQFLLVPCVTYIASWGGWFLHSNGWDRRWSSSPLLSLWHYHAEMWNFHTTLTETHSYAANPWSWLIMARPTSFFYASPHGCGASSCSQEILALGTPLLWWSATIALFVTFGYWIARREWQSGLLLLGFAAGYLPWLAIQKRTMFTFYAISFEPFMILLLVFALSKFLEVRDEDSDSSMRYRIYATYGLFALIALNFFYFLPLYIGQVITYSGWFDRMWLPSWI
ncbi:MAG: hypothetical protein RL414_376 [Actinomycetota bacterium]|jgi:dolichyl-phosphate-mannose--protein O-mannosyl transferase